MVQPRACAACRKVCSSTSGLQRHQNRCTKLRNWLSVLDGIRTQQLLSNDYEQASPLPIADDHWRPPRSAEADEGTEEVMGARSWQRPSSTEHEETTGNALCTGDNSADEHAQGEGTDSKSDQARSDHTARSITIGKGRLSSVAPEACLRETFNEVKGWRVGTGIDR